MVGSNLMLTIIGALAATSFSYFISIAYQHRKHFNQLQKQGVVSLLLKWDTYLPMPAGWSWIFGHFLVLLRYGKRLPPLANVLLVMEDMLKEFPQSEMLILDTWPAYPPVIANYNPEAGMLITREYNLPKTRALEEGLWPLVGGRSIITMHGDEWKTWRSRFNPGFSAAALMEQMPYIVDRVQVFCEKLRGKAGREIFPLHDFTTRLTFEIIMKVSLDADVDNQLSDHLLPTAMNTIARWHSFWDPRILLNPLRPFVQHYYGNIVKKYIRGELEKRFSELKAEYQGQGAPAGKRKKARSVIALALEAYISESEDKQSILSKPCLDDKFAAATNNQIRIFLLAGNDTTGSTIVWIQHLLSKHPEARLKLREEHNAVFGTDVSKAGARLKEQPALLNKCRYTLAVVKETLRVYPPTGLMRQGLPGYSVTTLDGVNIPTEGLYFLTEVCSLHHNPRVWVRPREFLPERWLAKEGDELYPLEGSYRPFDIGSRACLGQTLSLIELRVVLILTARSFEIEPAYEEWDEIQAKNEGQWKKMMKWMWGEEINTVMGFTTNEKDRAYQMDAVGTHPPDGYPCRVSLLEEKLS